MLVAIQWPTPAHSIDPHNIGVFSGRAQGKPRQHDDQDVPPGSTVKLHVLPLGFNARGRDFVGILGSFR